MTEIISIGVAEPGVFGAAGLLSDMPDTSSVMMSLEESDKLSYRTIGTYAVFSRCFCSASSPVECPIPSLSTMERELDVDDASHHQYS